MFLPPILRLIAAIADPQRLKQWEGKRARKMIEQRFGELKPNAYLTELGDRLAKHSNIEARFFLCSSPLVNAGALPNGDIVVWKGLFDKLRAKPDQMAGVLAHELGHLKHEHYLRAVYWVVLLQFVLGMLAKPLAGALSRNIAGRILNVGFSRFRELQADDEAVVILERADIDPRSLIGLFEGLDQQHQSPLAFLGTHPNPKKRAARIRSRFAVEAVEEDAPASHRNVIPFPTRRG
ncbi:MAG: M48 family metallopeptidase [Myxococcota bacterium]|nr:M48 family metallopeptidase [Myxococcota bacterium]